MARQAGSHDLWIALSGVFPDTIDAIRASFSGLLPPDRIVMFNGLPGTAFSNRSHEWRTRAGEVLRENFLAGLKPDIVYAASIIEGYGEDIVTSVGALPNGPPVGAIFYDAIPLIWGKQYLGSDAVRDWYDGKLAQVKRADILTAISASARAEAIEHLALPPDRVVNISAAASDFFAPIDLDEATRTARLQEFGIRRPYFLSAASFEPRKNLENLIAAYGLMPPEVRGKFQLVVVSSPDAFGRASLLTMAKDAGLAPTDLVITGYVDDERLRLLYASCHLFVYPSKHEGFGLPVLEAMKCGAASIGSNTTSIPEIIGRADAMFDPFKPNEIAALMVRSVEDPAYLATLRDYAPTRAATFSWDASARTALDALEETVTRTSRERPAAAQAGAGQDPYRVLVETVAPLLSSRAPLEVAEVATAIAADRAQLERSMALESLLGAFTRTKQVPGSIRADEMRYPNLSGGVPAPIDEPGRIPLASGLCRQADFMRDAYRYWMHALKEEPRFHRKTWEFFYVVQALNERGLLAPGRKGLGFGVGKEPLPALFASRGVKVLASDQGIEDAARAGWAQTDQHTTTASSLNEIGICPDDLFRENVDFREIDMNAIPSDLDNTFDFCWSACCLEHLGSIQHGLDFIVESIRILRPGGVAVHTTEFNMDSNSETIESRDLSLFRRRDIEAVVQRLQGLGYHVEEIDWSAGEGFLDGYVDLPPYKQEPHLRLKLGEYSCTSIGLIITKPA